MTFAEELRTARQRAGISTTALAERLQVSRRTVENWEQGRNVPGSLIKKIALETLKKGVDGKAKQAQK